VRLGLQERLADLTLDLPSVLVCNEGDQELPPERAWQWALHWNSQFASLGQGGMQVRIPGMPDGSASRTWDSICWSSFAAVWRRRPKRHKAPERKTPAEADEILRSETLASR